MRHAVFAATAVLGLAAMAQTTHAAEAPYLDDRSSAESVIQSLYSAINRHEFARAWGYYDDAKPTKDFDTFVKGYDGTQEVEVKTGTAASEGTAGSVYYSVPVAIKATDKSGNAQVFAGCYTLRQVSAQAQEPPFRPLPRRRRSCAGGLAETIGINSRDALRASVPSLSKWPMVSRPARLGPKIARPASNASSIDSRTPGSSERRS